MIALENAAWLFLYALSFIMTVIVVMLIGGIIGIYAPVDLVGLVLAAIVAGLWVCAMLRRARP